MMSRTMIRFISCAMLVLALPGLLFCLYNVAFWAWITATPVSPARLQQAQRYHYLWLSLSGLAFAIAVGCIVALIRTRRGKNHSGFEVIQ